MCPYLATPKVNLPDALFLALNDIGYLLTRKVLSDVALLCQVPNFPFERLCPAADRSPHVGAPIAYRMLVCQASVRESRPESIQVPKRTSQWWRTAVGLQRSFFERSTGLVIRSARRRRCLLRSTVISRVLGDL
jgi:hypothetical protein